MMKLLRTRRQMAVTAGVAAIAATVIGAAAPAVMSAPQALAAAKTAASTPQCSAGALGVWVAVDQAGVAAGTAYYPLEFTNISHHTCILYGYPGVSARNSNLKLLGNPARRDPLYKPRTVVLAPGATGHAILGYSDVVTSNCPSTGKRTAAFLQIYAPDQFQSNHAFWSLVACTTPGQRNFLSVTVVVAGIGRRG
jgi:Protein of unknown function (DUF4232)